MDKERSHLGNHLYVQATEFHYGKSHKSMIIQNMDLEQPWCKYKCDLHICFTTKIGIIPNNSHFFSLVVHGVMLVN